MRLFERTPIDSITSRDGQVVAASRRGVIRADRVALATNAYPPLLRRLKHYVVPVYDYVLVTEPLTDAQWSELGWSGREGVSDTGNQFHYYRTTQDGRILWGGYDAIYHAGNGFGPQYDHNRESYERLAEHFLQTFPQLRGIGFSHAWGGAIDTCSRFSAFWGTAHDGRVAYVAGYTGLGVGASRFGAATMLDLLDGRTTERTELEMVRIEAAAVPAGADPVPGHQPDHDRAAEGRRERGPAEPVAEDPRPPGTGLRLLTRLPSGELTPPPAARKRRQLTARRGLMTCLPRPGGAMMNSTARIGIRVHRRSPTGSLESSDASPRRRRRRSGYVGSAHRGAPWVLRDVGGVGLRRRPRRGGGGPDRGRPLRRRAGRRVERRRGRGPVPCARHHPCAERGRSPLRHADLRRRLRGRRGLPRHRDEPVPAEPARLPTRRSASSSATSSSRRSSPGSTTAGSPCAASASSRAWPTCSPGTRPTTCSARSTRSGSATGRTSSWRATTSRRPSRSGRPSRSASTRR